MNYIAHIHLGLCTQTSLLGNFLGDFVKGSDFSHLPLELQHGVRLHRKVDQYTDSYQAIVDLKRRFPTQVRRMAGVSLDIYFDYLLLVHWHQYADQSYHTLLARFYRELDQTPVTLTERFTRVRDSLLEHRWLENYKQPGACLNAFLAIEKRLNNRMIFAQQSIQYIESNSDTIEQVFLDFYPQLQAFSMRSACDIQLSFGEGDGR